MTIDLFKEITDNKLFSYRVQMAIILFSKQEVY